MAIHGDSTPHVLQAQGLLVAWSHLYPHLRIDGRQGATRPLPDIRQTILFLVPIPAFPLSPLDGNRQRVPGGIVAMHAPRSPACPEPRFARRLECLSGASAPQRAADAPPTLRRHPDEMICPAGGGVGWGE